jgi:tetratricopeptide (TPR) repeat protein
MIKKTMSCLIIIIISVQIISAQVEDNSSAEEGMGTESAPIVKIHPNLPQTGSSIIFIEGEDAVATNFNREPILNYSCSGYETLQLNKTTGLQGNSVYYSDYVFNVEEDGIYEFWYGGTPPGNQNELLPSFSSPLHYKLDSYYEFDVYREDVEVAGNYAPAYYWNYVSDLTLSRGEHRLTFEIPQRRSFDSKYYFYLDNFFLVKKIDDTRVLEGTTPAVFPDNLDDRSMDSPFKSIEDYEILIRDNPEKSRNYLEISMIYSLIGDYLSALKNLRKALLLEPDDPDIILLIAKNLIWKGAYQDGLYIYSDLLKLVPERIDLWTEAGKVSAWTGQYETSKEFFKNGIELYPENLNLQTNLGITYLWSGDSLKAENQFELVNEIAGDSLTLNKELAEIFKVNGYPDKAIEKYKQIIKLYPEDLETRFLLEDVYILNNQRDKIETLRNNTAEMYETTVELEKVLQVFYNKQTMKEKVIADYEKELINDPDNLILRKTLAEIYFWNGDKKKAINEYLNILTNYSYRNIRETEKDVIQFYEIMDRNYTYLHFLTKIPEYLENSEKDLNSSLSNYKRSLSYLDAQEKKNEALKVKGEEADLQAVSDLKDQLINNEDKLAADIAAKESFIEKYNSLLELFNDDTVYLTRLMEEEKLVNETFQKLTEGSHWIWDRNTAIRELNLVAANGLDLADYVLGKIYQIEGNLNSASSSLNKLSDNEQVLEDAPFAIFQNSLWMGDIVSREEIYISYEEKIISYDDYVYDLIEYIDYLKLEDDEIFGFLNENPTESVLELINNFVIITKELRITQKSVQNNILNIQRMLEEKMIQGFYKLAEETYLIRNELGDFYQQEEMFSEAIDQYRQVLAIDPWNLSAKYKLGLVNHWNGNWAKAMDLYTEVYIEDPVYGNVTSFYNQLAKQHADYLSFSGRTFADSSTLSFISSTEYKRNINGVFSLIMDYSSEEAGIFSGDSPNSRIQSLVLKLPIDLTLFTITAIGGVHMTSDYRFDSYSNPLEYLGRYDYKFNGGASLDTSIGPVILNGSYLYDWEYAWKDEVVDVDGDSRIKQYLYPLNFQVAEAAMQLNLAYTKIPIIEDTSTRLSGYGKVMEDSNIIWGTFYELLNTIPINSDPNVFLNLRAGFSYEDSTELAVDGLYWSPSEVLTAGGGFSLLTAFPVGKVNSVTNTIRFASGYYQDGGNSGISFEIANTLEFERKEFSGFLKILSSFKNQQTPVSNPMDYWSFTFEIGGRASLPDLLSL